MNFKCLVWCVLLLVSRQGLADYHDPSDHPLRPAELIIPAALSESDDFSESSLSSSDDGLSLLSAPHAGADQAINDFLDMPAHIRPSHFPVTLPGVTRTPEPPSPRPVPTRAEQNSFAQRYRARAVELENRLHDAALLHDEAARTAALNAIHEEAELYSQAVQSNGNAVYNTSAGFHHRFGMIGHDARRALDRVRLQQNVHIPLRLLRALTGAVTSERTVRVNGRRLHIVRVRRNAHEHRSVGHDRRDS